MKKGKIYIAHVTLSFVPEYCAGLALVEDGSQLSGYRTISTHVSSSYAWSLDDMRWMGHDADYAAWFPDGYELVEVGHFKAERSVSECAEEIIAAIRRASVKGGAE